MIDRLQDARAEHRRERQRHEARHEDRAGDHDREFAEHAPDDAASAASTPSRSTVDPPSPGGDATPVAAPAPPTPTKPAAAVFFPPSAAQSLTGSWVLDQRRSDSLDPFLRAMDLNWVARKLAMSISLVNTVLHTAHAVVLVDKSSLFTKRTVVWLDGVARDLVGDDGKVATLRAWVASRSFTPPSDAPVPLDAQARVPGTLVYIVDLPGDMGSTVEYRWRDGDTMVVRSELYSVGGERLVQITRYWNRAEAGNPLTVADVAAPALSERGAPTTRRTNPFGQGSGLSNAVPGGCGDDPVADGGAGAAVHAAASAASAAPVPVPVPVRAPVSAAPSNRPPSASVASTSGNRPPSQSFSGRRREHTHTNTQ